jgi:GT2 family glycosyltransferase
MNGSPRAGGPSDVGQAALEVAEWLARVDALRPCDGHDCGSLRRAESALEAAQARYASLQAWALPRAHTALESAVPRAWITRMHVPPSHRTGWRGRAVTLGKRWVLAGALGPLLRSRLERQERFNVALCEVLRHVVNAARLGGSEEVATWADGLLRPLAARGWPARQRAWNLAACDALAGRTAILEEVERLVSPLPAALPAVVRSVLSVQESFNRDVLVALTDLWGTRPAAVVEVPPWDILAWAPDWETPRAAAAVAASREWSGRFQVLLEAGEAGEGAEQATLDSLRAQSFTRWEVQAWRGSNPDHAFAADGPEAWVLLRAGERLPAHALSAVAAEFHARPDVAAVYGDEDTWTEQGGRANLWLKPSPSPELIRAVDLCGPLFVRREAFAAARPWETDAGRWWRYGMALRLLERGTTLARLPLVLSHQPGRRRELVPGPEGRRALEAHLSRMGEQADVTDAPGHLRVRHRVQGAPRVSIIVPFRDQPALLEQLLQSFRKTDYPHWELLLVSNDSQEPRTRALLAGLTDARMRVLEWNHPFNYSAINNAAAREARGEVLLFLNNDVEVLHPEWLEELVAQATRPGVGAVGAQLFFPDGTLQHAGVVVGTTGFAGHPFWRMRGDTAWTALGDPGWPRGWLAVTGACLAVRRGLFETVGGFDERFIVCGSDVDLCLRLGAAGHRTVFTPHSRLVHHESASRRLDAIPAADFWRSYAAYRTWLEMGDPFFHPALSLEDTRCGPVSPGAAGGEALALASLKGLCPSGAARASNAERRECLHVAEHLLGVEPRGRTGAVEGRLTSVRAWLPASGADASGLGWSLALVEAAGEQGVRVEWVVGGRETVRGAWARRLGTDVREVPAPRNLGGLAPVDLALGTEWTSAIWAARDIQARAWTHVVGGLPLELSDGNDPLVRRLCAELYGPAGGVGLLQGQAAELLAQRFRGAGVLLPAQVPARLAPRRGEGGLLRVAVAGGRGLEPASVEALLAAQFPGLLLEWLDGSLAERAADIVVDLSDGDFPKWEVLRWMAGGAAVVAVDTPWRRAWAEAGGAVLIPPHPSAVAPALGPLLLDGQRRTRLASAAQGLARVESLTSHVRRMAVAMGFQLE